MNECESKQEKLATNALAGKLQQQIQRTTTHQQDNNNFLRAYSATFFSMLHTADDSVHRAKATELAFCCLFARCVRLG